MSKVTTVKITDKLDTKLEQVRAEINEYLAPRVVKRNEVMTLAIERFLKTRNYRRAFKIDQHIRSETVTKDYNIITNI